MQNADLIEKGFNTATEIYLLTHNPYSARRLTIFFAIEDTFFENDRFREFDILWCRNLSITGLCDLCII